MLLGACDAGAAAEQPVDVPPLHVVDVLAATGTTPDGKLLYEPLARDGSTYVLSTTAIKVRFDRLLLPVSASRQAVCLQPLLKDVRSPTDCNAGLFLEPAYDPVRREVTFRLALGTKLTPGLLYTLTAYLAVKDTPFGFQSFDGAPLPALVRFEMGVKNDGDTPPPEDLLPANDHYCAGPVPSCEGDDCGRSVAAIFGATGCGSASCHGSADTAAGLDTTSASGLEASAIGRSAHGTQTGEHARDPDELPARFGRAMPIVDPAAPGNSYLLYKLLANPKTPLEVPFDGAPGAVPSEVQRVQRTIIAGMPMPPSTAIEATLRPGEAEWIGEWILQGAPVRATCP
ncbi:Hypothetical protein A7982_03457 [Minicystis rosea]|nr:Hypothetical protein A7982_03457 [Minicystis rosea]